MASGTVTGGTIHVEGLNELIRAFRGIDDGLRKKMRAELLAIADMVASEARSFAVGRGLVDDQDAPPGGGLVDTIKPSIRGASVLVVDTAKRVSPKYPGGYPYPSRYEFGNGGARAFMRPAVDHVRPRAELALEAFLDRLGRAEGF